MLSYVDFNLVLTYQASRRPLLIARADCSLTGEIDDLQHQLVDGDLEELLNVVGNPDVRVRELADVGDRLGRLLLPPGVDGSTGVDALFVEAYQALRPAQGLRIRLRCRGADEIRRLPWEFARIRTAAGAGAEPLALDPKLSLVRHERVPGKPPEPQIGERLVVVSVDAGTAARGYPELPPESPDVPPRMGAIPVEGRQIEPTRDALRRGLRGTRADIFFFSGHGEPEGVVLGHPDGRGADLLPAADLAQMLVRAGVQLVVLSACHSADSVLATDGGGVAQAMVESGIPIVVAMQHKVAASSAAAFVTELFRALFAGLSVDEAVSVGRQRLGSGADYGRPVLYHRSVGGAFLTDQPADLAPTPAPPPRPTHAHRLRETPRQHAAVAAVPARTGASWSQLSRGDDTWRIEPRDRGPRLAGPRGRLDPVTPSLDRAVIAVTPDCAAAVQWSGGSCRGAWINRLVPRFASWARDAPVRVDGEAQLLAASYVRPDQIEIILSTARQTLKIRVGPRGAEDGVILYSESSRAAVYLDPSTVGTVDPTGRIREDHLARRLPALVEVDALDSAWSAGTELIAGIGLDAEGSPMVVGTSVDEVYQEWLDAPATGVVVERRLDRSERPRCIVVAAGTTVSAHDVTDARVR